MARTRSISDEQILEAAHAAFLEHGFQVATSEIARRAGVSEGTIFKRFPTKEALFVASMHLTSKPDWVERLASFDVEGDMEAQLVELTNDLIDHARQMVPKMMMVMTSGKEVLDNIKSVHPPPPVVHIKRLMGLFQRLQEAGVLKPGDTEVMVRIYFGAILHFAFGAQAGFQTWLPMPQETFTRTFVRYLLDGIGVTFKPE